MNTNKMALLNGLVACVGLSLSVVMFVSVSGCVNHTQKTEVTKEANKEIKQEKQTDLATVKTQQNYLLLDVRSLAQYQTDGLNQAINIPYDDIANQIAKVTQGDKSQEIKLYCRSGRRAGVAQETLAKLGYHNVTNLKTVALASEYIAEHPVYQD